MRLQAAKGFSLIGSMLALCILCIGMVACLSLHSRIWQSSRQVAEFGAARALAAELAEWLRSSSAHAESGSAAAQHWMPGWKARLEAALPAARAQVCHDERPWDEAASAWRWECTGAAPDAALVIKIHWGGDDGPILALLVAGAGASSDGH